MFRIKVMDHQSAFHYVYNHAGFSGNKNFAVLSIQEYPTDMMGIQYKCGGNCKGALNVWFSDITDKDRERQGTYIKLITEEDAEEIYKFVMNIKDKDIDQLIIHCNMGVSRSPAVAAAISKALTGSDDEFFGGKFIPNMVVYYTVLKAFGLDNTPQFSNHNNYMI